MYPLKKVLFTTDASYVMEKEGCDLDEAQFLIEDQWGGFDYNAFPVVAKHGKLKRWDGIHDLEDMEAKSVSDYIAKLIARKADEVYIGEDEDGLLLVTWTHHDGWGRAAIIKEETGEVVTAKDLWAY